MSGSLDPDIGLSRGVVVRDNYIHDTGFGGIAIANSVAAQILDNEVADTVDLAGINSTSPADNLVISGNTIHGNVLGGVSLSNPPLSSTTTQQAVVDGNTLFENGASGFASIGLHQTKNCLVVNNLLYGNHGAGIEVEGDNAPDVLNGNQVANNTVVQAADGDFPFVLSNVSDGNGIFNNILLSGGLIGSIEADSASTVHLTEDNNVVFGPVRLEGVDISLATWQSLGFDVASISATASELFVSVASDNYDLKAGSPAIDSGRFFPGAGLDIRGVSRPQGVAYDIGAYEYFVPGPQNHNPVANAGNDQTVPSGAVVHLSGGGSSDPDGDTLSYSWVQTIGPSVALQGATTSAPMFTAPEFEQDTTLTFQLTVTDGRGVPRATPSPSRFRRSRFPRSS